MVLGGGTVNETLIINSTLFAMALFLFCNFRNEFSFPGVSYILLSRLIAYRSYIQTTSYSSSNLGSVFFKLVSRFHLILYGRIPKVFSPVTFVQGGSNMTGTDLCVNKPHCAAAVRP